MNNNHSTVFELNGNLYEVKLPGQEAATAMFKANKKVFSSRFDKTQGIYIRECHMPVIKLNGFLFEGGPGIIEYEK